VGFANSLLPSQPITSSRLSQTPIAPIVVLQSLSAIAGCKVSRKRSMSSTEQSNSEDGSLVRLPLAAEFSDHQGRVTCIAIDDSGANLYSADDEVNEHNVNISTACP